MRSVADYATLGRLEGAGHAKAMAEQCLGAEPALIAIFETQRLKMVLERMQQLDAEGASVDALAAYGEAVNRRFAESIAEMVLDAELTANSVQPPSPPGNRKARRAARKQLH